MRHCYDEELEMLKEYFGEKCVYNGKMNSKQKDAQKAFMTDPNIMDFYWEI